MGNPNLFGNRALINHMYDLDYKHQIAEGNARQEEMSAGELKLFKIRINADWSEVREIWAQSKKHAEQKALEDLYISQDDLDIDTDVIEP